MLTLQKLWAIQWVWPITAYVFLSYSEIRTNLRYMYGHRLFPGCPDKRGLTVLLRTRDQHSFLNTVSNLTGGVQLSLATLYMDMQIWRELELGSLDDLFIMWISRIMVE